MDSNLSQTSASTSVVTEIHKEDPMQLHLSLFTPSLHQDMMLQQIPPLKLILDYLLLMTLYLNKRSQRHKLELEKNKVEAEAALLRSPPSFPNTRQLNELLVKSLQTEFSKILSAHDFSGSLPTELKKLPSKFNELTKEVKGLKKQVYELEIELPRDLKEIHAKLEDFTKIDVQEMTYSEQTHIVDFPDNEINGDSNIISYSQYLQESQDAEQAFWLKHSSISKTHVKSHTTIRIEAHSALPKVFAIAPLKNKLRKLKGKNVVDTAVSTPIATTIAQGMFKLDIELIFHRLKNNKDAHEDYLRNTIEITNTIRGLVEHTRISNLSKPFLDSACRFTKHVQELLVYVSKTCRNLPKPSEKLVVVTPLNKDRKVSASGSKPSGNTKNNMISQSSSSNKPNKVEDQSRSVKSRKNKKNYVDKTECNAHVMKSMLNANSVSEPIRNRCPLTRITSTKVVPTKETTTKSVVTPTQGILVYSRRPKASRSVGSSRKVKIVESNTPNTTKPNQSWGSIISDVPSSSLIDCRKPDLSYLYVFGALCYPTNDGEDIGKLKPKGDIRIFVGYAPAKKELVPHSDHVFMITLKWIYKVKLDEPGGVLKNKARLVVRGYCQEEGIYFEESFALVA
nr:retrovirus-related Pol polyprotein from transposon TNT 1-94 [Tanacetum cinerariifolium]